MPHDDHIRRVAALDQDHRLLVAAAGFGGAHALGTLEPEEPDDEGDERQSDERDDPAVRGHGAILFGSKKRRRLALLTTVTELKAMAAAAISGERSNPKNGYRSPIATGMPSVL